MIKNMVPEQINAERLTIESYNQELDEAVARIEAGVFVSHEEALQQLNL
jgi:predicted transcriptional regulator